MKKNLLAILVFSVAVLMSSCGFEDGAGYVNDILVERTDKVEALLLEAFNHIDVDEYDSALAYPDSVTNHVKESEVVIAKLKNKSAEKLQQATLEYLAMFKTGVIDCKQAIECYRADGNMEEAYDLINNFVEKADTKLEEMQEIQVEFAKANNIILK